MGTLLFGTLRPLLDVLLVLRYTLHLLAVEGITPEARQTAFDYRVRLSKTMVDASPSWEDRLVLATIARHESRFDFEVGRCAIASSAGALGPWQVVPFTQGERQSMCINPDTDAYRALMRVRESQRMCRYHAKPLQLAAYAVGKCDSEEGQRLSLHRWPLGWGRE